MKSIKNTVALFLGVVAATTEFVPESKQDLFKLDEDKLIIESPLKPENDN